MHCGRCGQVIEFQSQAIEAAMREVCQQHLFNSNGHTLVIRGTCAECNRARGTKRRLDLI
jgi:Fur family ferric uptake transcriptional regulator